MGRTVNIFSCCRRAAQKESEGRMRPAGRTLPITAIIGDINNTKYVIFNMLIINLLGPRTSD